MTDTNLSPNADAVLGELRAIRALLAEARTDPVGGLLDKEQVAALTALGESTVDYSGPRKLDHEQSSCVGSLSVVGLGGNA